MSEKIENLLNLALEASEEEREPSEFQRSWNYAPGERLELRCYSNRGKPAVTLNGRPLDLLDRTEENGAYVCAVDYEPGTLAASAGGVSDVLETTGAAVAIRLEQAGELIAGSTELCCVELALTDAAGRIVPNAENRLYVAVGGGAELVALDNGDLFDPTDCQSPERRACRGQLAIYVRPAESGEPAIIQAQGDGLRPQTVTLVPVGGERKELTNE